MVAPLLAAPIAHVERVEQTLPFGPALGWMCGLRLRTAAASLWIGCYFNDPTLSPIELCADEEVSAQLRCRPL